MISQILVSIFIVISIVSFAMLKQRHIVLSIRIILALFLGLFLGILLKWIPQTDNFFFITTEFLRFIGSGYLLLLKMLVLPLIVTSILNTMLNLGGENISQIKKISFSACALLLLLTGVGSLIGILIGTLFNVGAGIEVGTHVTTSTIGSSNITDTLLAMIPSNPFASMVKENTLAIVIFTILIGYAARKVNPKDAHKIEIFKQLINALFNIIKKLTLFVLEVTPFGIFGLIALLFAMQGSQLLLSMLTYVAAMHVAMVFMIIIHSILVWTHGYHPVTYFKKAGLALFVAFTTRSSFGTLPVSEEVLRQKFKTNSAIPALVPSIGATLGMNACAGIFPAMLVVMTLGMLNQPLTWQFCIIIMLINMLASLGISGIPGTASIAASVTLGSLGLPYTALALVQGIDPIVDMGRTAINVNGTLTTSLVINKYLEEEETLPSPQTVLQNETH